MATSDRPIDPVYEQMSYVTARMLVEFAKHKSFAQVAAALGERVNQRQVSAQLRDLNNAWSKTRNVRLLEEPGAHSKNWKLTEVGEQLAEALKEYVAATHTTLELVESGRRIPVVCTRSSLADFSVLSRAVRAKARLAVASTSEEVTLRPVASNSSEIRQRVDDSAAVEPFYIYSTLGRKDREHATQGSIFDYGGDTQALVIRTEPIRLLLSTNLTGRLSGGPLALADVLHADQTVVIMTPPGGVAWEYIQAVEPELQRLHPGNLEIITDLDYGLQCFKTGAWGDRNLLMVVHGWQLDDERLTMVKNAELRDVTDGDDWVAVINLIRRTRAWSFNRDATDLVWATAKRLWQGKPLQVVKVGS